MLEGIQLFDSLSQEEKQKLSMFCQERILEDDEILFNEGDDAIAMYILKSGMLKVYKNTVEGEKILAYTKPEEMVGEMGIFSNEPKKRNATVRAVEKSSLIVIMNYSIMELSKTHPEIHEKIMQIIEKRALQNSSKL